MNGLRALAALVAIASGGGVPLLAAQAPRLFTTARQLHGETRLGATVDYAAGTLTITPGAAATLYRMQLSFDAERSRPLSAFDATSAAVRLGATPASGGPIRRAADVGAQNAVIEISPEVDLSLELGLGAVDAAVELGGLRLTGLHIANGASRTTLRFSRLNPVRCRSATIEAGAAELRAVGLGNSRCERIDVQGGIGRMTLDFSGAWPEDAEVAVRMAVGELVLRLPRDLGVRLTLDRFLASFQPAGLVPRGAGFVSPGYDEAARRLEIALTTAVGGVRIEWID